MRFPSALNPDPEVWKSGLRTAAAGGLAFICAEILALPQGYWAVMTAIVIMQASIGGRSRQPPTAFSEPLRALRLAWCLRP